MKKFVPRQRNGKPIKDYKKRHEFIIPGVPEGVKVPGKSASDLEKALKIFKRQSKDLGTLQELKSRREYVKKSLLKRRKKDAAIRQLQKEERYRKANEIDCWTTIVNGQAQ